MERQNAESLTELFRQLGAADPELWARSQINEGIPQLARFLFLRQAWSRIVSDSDPSWIGAYMRSADARPNDPYAGVGHGLRALLSKGATPHEITSVVRGMQAELLFGLCYMLEDPGLVEEEVQDICWQLFLVNDDGEPQQPLAGLHESVLETDPTGREMRPNHDAG